MPNSAKPARGTTHDANDRIYGITAQDTPTRATLKALMRDHGEVRLRAAIDLDYVMAGQESLNVAAIDALCPTGVLTDLDFGPAIVSAEEFARLPKNSVVLTVSGNWETDDDEDVEDVVDKVVDNAEEYGYVATDLANARELANEWARNLGIELDDEQIDEAARRIMEEIPAP